MIVLIIIVLLLALILYLPISMEVKYIGGEFSYKVKYAFITFYPKKQKPVKKKSKSKNTKDKSISKLDTSPKKEPEKKSVMEKSNPKKDASAKSKDTKKESNKDKSINDIDLNALDTLSLALDIFKVLKDKLGNFITNIRITDLYINFQVADLDAYDCALKFGKLNIVLGNILGLLNWKFRVKKKSISVLPKYNSNSSLYDISFKIKIGFGNGLGRILVMLFKVIPILKQNDII